MADRQVRTNEGAARFHRGIGTAIAPDGSSERPAVVSVERLRSMAAMIATQKGLGNKALAASLQGSFRQAIAAFAKGKSPAEVSAALAVPEPEPKAE